MIVYLVVQQTVSIPFSEKMAKDGKMIIEYHDEDVLVGINGASIHFLWQKLHLNSIFNIFVEFYVITLKNQGVKIWS